MARALIAALECPDESRRWAEQALASVGRFSAGRMVERTLEEYRAVLAERAGGGPAAVPQAPPEGEA